MRGLRAGLEPPAHPRVEGLDVAGAHEADDLVEVGREHGLLRGRSVATRPAWPSVRSASGERGDVTMGIHSTHSSLRFTHDSAHVARSAPESGRVHT